MSSRRLLLLPLTLLLLLSGCATAPLDPRDPAIYRPAPAHYPPLP